MVPDLLTRRRFAIRPTWLTLSPKSAVFLTVLAVLVCRIPFFASGIHGYDGYGMAEWTWALAEHGPGAFYATGLDVPPDHLPGDLWLLWLLGWPIHALDPGFDFYASSWVLVLKTIATLGDLVIALALLLGGSRLVTPRLGMMLALAFALNPAAIMISAVWGQWDSLSMAAVMVGLLVLGRGRLPLATVLLVFACLVKPQLAILWPGVAIYVARTSLSGIDWRRWPWRRLAATVAAGVATFYALCVPFGVSLLGIWTPWSIGDRLAFAMDRYQSTTLGAFNLWMIPIGREVAPLDSEMVIAGLTSREIGLSLLLLACGLAWLGAWRMANPDDGLLWSSVVTTLGFFLFATRAHERYLFPAMVLSFLLVLVWRRSWWIAATLSLTLFLSVWSSLAWEWVPGGTTLGIPRDVIVQVLSVANLLAFAGVLGCGWRGWQTSPGRRERRSWKSAEVAEVIGR